MNKQDAADGFGLGMVLEQVWMALSLLPNMLVRQKANIYERARKCCCSPVLPQSSKYAQHCCQTPTKLGSGSETYFSIVPSRYMTCSWKEV